MPRTEELSTQRWALVADTVHVRPRPIHRNTTYMITRRTTQRLLLMRPSTEINACIRYCVALAQHRSGVLIHALTFLSNHYHIILTDQDGTLPVFTEELNKLIARSLNCLHGRWENFWAGGAQTSHVLLESDVDVLAKTVYTLANPVAALLVSHGGDWPGVRLFRQGKYQAKRPSFFFRGEEAGGRLPSKLDLVLTAPPIGVDHKRADDVVKAAVSAREKELRDRAKAEGKSFKGASAVKAQRVEVSPKSAAPRRGLSPRLACQDKWRRIERLRELGQFVYEHAERRLAFLSGIVDVVFPCGTYRFVRQFGARCADG